MSQNRIQDHLKNSAAVKAKAADHCSEVALNAAAVIAGLLVLADDWQDPR